MKTSRILLVLACSAALLPAGCETVAPTPVKELDLWDDAAAGVEHPALVTLCREVWAFRLETNPFDATYKGDPRFDDRVPQISAHARRLQRERLVEFVDRARAIRPANLTPTDRITRELLLEELENDLAVRDLDLESWTVDPLQGPHVRILNLAAVQPHDTAGEREALVARWNAFGGYLRAHADNLRRGLRRDRVASYTAVVKSIQQLEAILDTDPLDSPLVDVAKGDGRWVDLPDGKTVAEIAHEYLGDARRHHELRAANPHLGEGHRLAVGTRVLVPSANDPLSFEERGRFLYGVLEAVEDEVYPALAAYRDQLSHEVMPRARRDSEPGLTSLPGGKKAYRTLIHAHTSLPLEECAPEAIHEFGLAEVARIRGEIAELGGRLFGTREVAAIQAKLRNDPNLYFSTRDEVEGKAVEAVATAEGRLAEYFGILPVADCDVVRIAPFEERDTTIAYYRGPSATGDRPGQYFINTFKPETRPRYEAEVLAFHEAVPGHHLQIAIAQELDDLPLFRRHGGSTAFVEGWALYTERLCDEMGLYSGDLDRLGMLSFDAWRASRLVVDTGLHAFGWSREEAIDYLFSNTLLAKNNVENEVDRYIAWPGQALAYKIGQRELLTLREQARRALGDRFSYREFHDRVLENGAVTLSVLRGIVERWLAEA